MPEGEDVSATDRVLSAAVPSAESGARLAGGVAGMSERIRARYLIETADDPRRAVEVMAGEQSSGTFVAVPGETPELKARAGGAGRASDAARGCRCRRACRARRKGRSTTAPRSSCPGRSTISARRCRTSSRRVAGNLFELQQFSGLRLLDIDLPPAFAGAYPGPQFGIEGTRRLSGVAAGPLIGTIVKPSVGLSPEETADLVDTLCEAGIDFIKDDELQADGPDCPFEARARAVMAVINAHADRTGKKVMFAFNVTGDLDEMRRRHDLVRRPAAPASWPASTRSGSSA